MSFTGGPPLRKSLSSTAGELRSFIDSLKGKSPAEAMGVVAKSGLMRGVIISAVVQVALLLLLTIPFALMPKKPKPVVVAPVAAQPVPAAPARAPAATKPDSAAPKVLDNGTINNVMRTDTAKPEDRPPQRDPLDSLR